MDGLVDFSVPLRAYAVSSAAGRTVPMGRTVATAIGCVGVGVHSGRRARLTFRPAAGGTGIVFRRTDLRTDIPARFDRVSDTRLCTVLSAGGATVGTVEHVMAALSGAGVTDAVVEVDGPEVPILDGSAAPFVFLLDCAGFEDTGVAARTVEVLRTVRVEEGEAWAELSPDVRGGVKRDGLDMELSIAFAAPAIGRQSVHYTACPGAFAAELAYARTFALRQEVEALHAAGLGLGGSLDNAVVVDGAAVLNPGGLRAPDEFARHKMLDAVGDLALAGATLAGSFRGHRSGHALNNRLLRRLFADAANWREVPAPGVLPGVLPGTLPVLSGWTGVALPAAALPA